MTPFICPTCGSETWKFIARDNKDKLVCPRCYKSDDMRPSYLHQKMEGATSKGLTVAKSHIIDNRRICPEDKAVVIDRRTGKETQY